MPMTNNNNNNNNTNNSKNSNNNDAKTAWGGGNTVGRLHGDGGGIEPPNNNNSNSNSSSNNNMNPNAPPPPPPPTANPNMNPWQQQQQQQPLPYGRGPPPPPPPHQYVHYGQPIPGGRGGGGGYNMPPPPPPSSLQQQQQYMHMQQQQQQQQQQRPGGYYATGPPPPQQQQQQPPPPGAEKNGRYRSNYYSRHGGGADDGNPKAPYVGGNRNVGMWQQNYPGGGGGQPQPPQGGGGSGITTYYNNVNSKQGGGGGGGRVRKTLNITDHDGNPIDLTASAPKRDKAAPSSLAGAADAGKKLLAAAEHNLKNDVNAREERERQERLKKEKEEEERLERERLEKERAEKERLEKERAEKERLEKERAAAEERERRELLERERLEKRRLEREEAERQEKKRLEAIRAEEASKKTMLRPGGGSGGLRPGSGGSGLRPGSGGSGLRPGGAGLRPGGKSRGAGGMGMGMGGDGGAGPGTAGGERGFVASDKRIVYTKEEILRLKELPKCCERPPDLADMTISQNYPNSGSNHRGGGPRQSGRDHQQSQWARGANAPNYNSGRGNDRRGDRNNNNRDNAQWSRDHALPPARNEGRGGRGRGGRGGGRGRRGDRHRNSNNDYDEYTGPVAPLVRSENRWVPQKNTGPIVALEKKIKSILNKMTKEKFQKLSNQMIEIPIHSYEMLTVMIHRVYEKAIDEPAFGDMYADLCCRMADTNTGDYIHLVQSNEGKPDLSDLHPKKDSKELARWETYQEGAVTWRWSNDVGVDDEQVVGPFDTVDQCLECAVKGEGVPAERGDIVLNLEVCRIVDGVFCKVLVDPEENKYYAVYFAVEDAGKSEQQLSRVFPTEDTCRKDASKENSFKRTLLNKCEDEFNKQDIYVEWQKEMKESKSKLSDAEIKEKDEEMEFRRMKIKKQMLGNIKFIGELYKKHMIRVNIMHYCIQSLLKMEEDKKTGTMKDVDEDMDEEDHEALCQLFSTIGKELDTRENAGQLRLYFEKVHQLSSDPALSPRSQFMYKDLIDLRAKNWKERREKLQAKTIQEIHKDIAREERQKEQQAQNNNYRGGGGNRGGGGGGGGDYRGGDVRKSQSYGGNRGSDRGNRQVPSTDSSGFTAVTRGRGSFQATPQMAPVAPSRAKTSGSSSKQSSSKQSGRKSANREPAAAPAPAPAPTYPPLPEDKLKLRVANIANEFIADPSNASELLLSFDEILGTPNASKSFTQTTVDRLVDCKALERPLLVTMLMTLFKASKIASSDLEFGLEELIEFIDSYVYDCPKIFEVVGDVVSKFIHAKGLTVSWLCSACEKHLNAVTNKDECATHAEVVKQTVLCMKGEFGNEAKQVFMKEEASVVKVIGGSHWDKIKALL